jgi:hypothetical protein
LACAGLAILIAVVALRAFEIARGGPPLPSPKAQDGLFVVAAVIILKSYAEHHNGTAGIAEYPS